VNAINTATLAADGHREHNYSCNIAVEPRCVAGNVFINAAWELRGKDRAAQRRERRAGRRRHLRLRAARRNAASTVGDSTGTGDQHPVTASGPFVVGLKGVPDPGARVDLVPGDRLTGHPGAGHHGELRPQAPAARHHAAQDERGQRPERRGNGGIHLRLSDWRHGDHRGDRHDGASVSQVVAVRGAKPSANGFYFHCEHAALPVYTTIGEFETMTCTVRLTDRYGNRVGIPTVVSFATEAGAIAASVTTKGFDVAKPNDTAEGTATVTFTSDMGNGNSPADVAPLGPTAQFPWARGQEPSRNIGSLTLNPRDQLVTIVRHDPRRGGLRDANGDGVFSAGEAFVDEGDPFVDADDNGA